MEVAYLNNLSWNEADIKFMDELRYYRNGIKYYGKILDEEYARQALDFLKRNYPLLK
ncbi:hypothetical protein JW711_02525 [Candidatus Woesearchaeota archaeon]|nr:hypothetical protein [Candidatus Woesearchaeota archaeon]